MLKAPGALPGVWGGAWSQKGRAGSVRCPGLCSGEPGPQKKKGCDRTNGSHPPFRIQAGAEAFHLPVSRILFLFSLFVPAFYQPPCVNSAEAQQAQYAFGNGCCSTRVGGAGRLPTATKSVSLGHCRDKRVVAEYPACGRLGRIFVFIAVAVVYPEALERRARPRTLRPTLCGCET